jgi:hypothetical protein
LKYFCVKDEEVVVEGPLEVCEFYKSNHDDVVVIPEKVVYKVGTKEPEEFSYGVWNLQETYKRDGDTFELYKFGGFM